MKAKLSYQLGIFLLLGSFALAQETPKAELSLDYSFARYAPSASYTKGHSLNGGGGRFVYNFGQHFGIGMDLQGYNSNTTTFVIPSGSPNFPKGGSGTVSGDFFTYLFGPVIKFRPPHVHPYFDVLAGAAHSNVYGNAYQTICQPTTSGCTTAQTPDGNGFALSAGGGLDIPINRRVDFKVGEFDYLYTRFTNIFNDAGQNNFRYLGGLNINMGLPNPKMPTVACAVEPASVLPWEGPVRASVTPTDFNPKHDLTYSWDSSGGTASGQGVAATVDTTKLTPGQYTIRANVSDQKQKKNNTATCTGSFTVKEPHAPVVACNASPATVKPGEPITITVNGSSPDLSAIEKRNFSASAGALREGETSKGNQAGEFTTVATLDTTSASAGPLNVTVGVTDVHGLTGNCTATAEVVIPPPPPAPPADLEKHLELHSIFFPTALPNEKRPDAGLAESQEQTLSALASDFKTYLQFKPDATLTLTGHADPRGSAEYNKGLSQRRVDSAKHHLVEQGVPESAVITNALGDSQPLTKEEVKDLVEKNPDLEDAAKQKVLRQINKIYLAQNRRVDVTLTHTGQQSVQLYPFNASDAATLLSDAPQAHAKKPAPK